MISFLCLSGLRFPLSGFLPLATCHLSLVTLRVQVRAASGPGRCSEFFDPKVRGNPRPIEFGEESPDTTGQDAAQASPQARAARVKACPTDSVTENKLLRRCDGGRGDARVETPAVRRRLPRRAARVKRWSKSPPRHAQAGRHEKPRPVQGKIGGWAARPTATGMLHLPSLLAGEERRAGASRRERNDD